MSRRCKECGEEHAAIYLNGRPAVDWEVPIIERARRCERSRDLELLAGVLTGDDDERRPVGVPLARQAPELKARKRTRTITDLSLDPLS